MADSTLLHDLIRASAQRSPEALALTYGTTSISYAALQAQVDRFAAGLLGLGLARTARVGIWLEKRFETVVASFGAPAAGGVFVPMNPLLKPEQVVYIARDCDVQVLVTSPERLALLAPVLAQCPSIEHVVLTAAAAPAVALPPGVSVHAWDALQDSAPRAPHRVIDTDLLAILYTSGSTGRPKGVVLSHRNMVAGAKSVASYLENRASDTLLAALPCRAGPPARLRGAPRPPPRPARRGCAASAPTCR